MTDRHEEKVTAKADVIAPDGTEITIAEQADVITPEHADRVTTPLFTKSKKALYVDGPINDLLVKRDSGKCWICGGTEAELGEPLEAHHFGIERSFAEDTIDWSKVAIDYPSYDWSTFSPTDPYAFVDDMVAQGILLCKKHHTGKNHGIHYMPFSIWILQRYLKDGTEFQPKEVIHHFV